MSNIDAVNALITAINFDRFEEIEARHSPDVEFFSFVGPILRSSTGIEDWQRKFRREYADCTYTELEYIDQDDTVAVRATIEAKGYDWRPFTQRIIEIIRLNGEEVQERRMYGMLQNLELDKPSTAAMNAATEFRGGNAATTRKLLADFYAAALSGDRETAATFLDDKAVLIDTVYGVANGPQNILDLRAAIPRPATGTERVTHSYAGAKDGCVEIAIDPARPRLAEWVRIVDGKIKVIESYWMLREIGVVPEMKWRRPRLVIMPM
ncbi:MAG: nuclear transport factor 2 family protein [Dehalococcoidia bacterium]|nr:nuclear transport factor 2 family protein [Dehalococcoidia bacterium]